MDIKDTFPIEKEFNQVINRLSLENGSNTPDFLLAKFLSRCLVAYDAAVTKRDSWFNINPWEVKEKIKSLESSLASMTAERDRLRVAVKRSIWYLGLISGYVSIDRQVSPIPLGMHPGVVIEELEAALAGQEVKG